MLDRVTGLQVFTRVAALGSLSAAARALDMSQTMATKHMGALEDRLGIRLLHRTTRRVTLTEAGRNYLESVERILGDLEEADAAASAETVAAYSVGQQIAIAAFSFALAFGMIFFVFRFRSFKEIIARGKEERAAEAAART